MPEMKLWEGLSTFSPISVLEAVFEKVKGEVLPSASPSVYNQRCLR